MSRRPAFDDQALRAAIGPRAPAGFSREERVKLLAEVFQALVEDRAPNRAAALFVGGGGQAWLAQGGDLLRDYWKVKAPKGSHLTPSALHRDEGGTEN